jgi:ElaB/YqjD/DUF883 family membrane-anchored ribosome-binding protein
MNSNEEKFLMSANTSQRPDSIQDALQVLENALANDPAPALKELISDDYTHLKSFISKTGSQGAVAAGESLNDLNQQIRGISMQAFEAVSDIAASAVEGGLVEGKELARRIDSGVRANPWPVIGGIVIGTLALGFLIGRNSNEARS